MDNHQSQKLICLFPHARDQSVNAYNIDDQNDGLLFFKINR